MSGGGSLRGTRAMKGFGKIALVFSLVGGLMAYFIIPVQFSRKRALSPADKAEYALTVNYYQSHCGPVLPEIEERAKAYASESGRSTSPRSNCQAFKAPLSPRRSFTFGADRAAEWLVEPNVLESDFDYTCRT